MALSEFIQPLQQLVGTVNVQGNKVDFEYIVPLGTFRGRKVRIGFEVPSDFPLVPPGGPHVSPQLIPINQNGATHQTRAHPSSFGADWEYWSRPFANEWNKTDKTVKTYMSYIRKLFDEL
ncbi:MAG: hypothetical protein C7B44_12810 [Sulfobacillus thermosulfidooxidans]|nr:MAG: hypothetical protein C7B44_12810 [Sulfobacillus thermosulfidooxidans]